MKNKKDSSQNILTFEERAKSEASIHKNNNANIFDILSQRYKKSAPTRLLEESSN